jgi:sugar lactone lactonase YvrE
MNDLRKNFQTIEIYFFYLHLDMKWKRVGITVAGGNNLGKRLNQFSFPQGISIDDDQTIYIADWWNNRIVEWKCKANTGQIVAGGNGKGNEINQLKHPTNVIIDREDKSLIICDCENGRIIRRSRENNAKEQIIISDIDCVGLAMDKNGNLYVSDCVKNEVRRYNRRDKKVTIVAGGNELGDHLNQLNYPTYIFVDEDDSLYVSDMKNHRVMKWLKDATEGIIVAGGNGSGYRSMQLSYPEGVIVDQLGQIYVADSLNHRVMRWCTGATEGTIVVGGNGKGDQANQLNGPIDLSFDRQGNLYVVDCWNHRVQKFEIDLDEKNILN